MASRSVSVFMVQRLTLWRCGLIIRAYHACRHGTHLTITKPLTRILGIRRKNERNEALRTLHWCPAAVWKSRGADKRTRTSTRVWGLKFCPVKPGCIRRGHIGHGCGLAVVGDGAEDMPIRRVGGVFDGDDLPWWQQNVEAGNVVGWRIRSTGWLASPTSAVKLFQQSSCRSARPGDLMFSRCAKAEISRYANATTAEDSPTVELVIGSDVLRHDGVSDRRPGRKPHTDDHFQSG
jgi:hypothetical protein